MQKFLRNGIEVDICDHGEQRFSERTSFKNSEGQGSNAWNAFCYGLRTKDCNGYLRNCMEHYEKSWFEEKGRELRYYKGMIYVFEKNCMITLFELEDRVRKACIKKCDRQKKAKWIKQIQNGHIEEVFA